jgi:pyruvate carboxylase
MEEGLNLGNKLTTNHLKFEKHKMTVRLAAQTLSSSVANAIDFLDKSARLPNFSESNGTVKFIRTIDRLFDMLNSRNPLAKGFKAPL